MDWEFTHYSLLLATSAVISGGLAIFVWRRRPARSSTSLAILGLGAAEWSLGYAVALGFKDLPARIFWAKMQHPGIAVIPVAMLFVVLAYIGRQKWLTRGNFVLLSIVPFLDVLLAWTNEAHGLIWADVKLIFHQSLPVLDLQYGAFFWVFTTYTYLLLLIATLLLLSTLPRSSSLRRRQIAIMLTGMMIPWVGNFLYLTGWNPFPHLDLTPFSFTLAGVIIAFGLFRYHLVDIVSIARANVLKSMRDGVIVLDAQDHVVDFNPAGEHMTNLAGSEVIGQPVREVFSTWSEFPARYLRGEAEAEFILDDKQASTYDVNISPLYDRHRHYTGRVVVLHDITPIKKVEEGLRKREAHLEELVRERTQDLESTNEALRQEIVAHRRAEEELRRMSEQYKQLSGRLLTVQDEERERISREIHDSLGQYLASLSFQFDLMKRKSEKVSPDVVGYLEGVDNLIKETIHECHRLSFELSPPSLRKLGLVQAMGEVASHFRARTGIQVDFLASIKRERLPKDQELTLFRILQEALTNVLKHAFANRVKIQLYKKDEQIHFRISDDGTGFELAHSDPGRLQLESGQGGLGLLSMRERVTHCQGRFQIESKVGKGTTITVSVPIVNT